MTAYLCGDMFELVIHCNKLQIEGPTFNYMSRAEWRESLIGVCSSMSHCSEGEPSAYLLPLSMHYRFPENSAFRIHSSTLQALPLSI
mmetsp:Transcript_31286/g.65914  ORF Transcript_31286/g.65914 Transcript_31286/m.65914 type:complete len:87 (-) Transcript_31286:168-428(-)